MQKINKVVMSTILIICFAVSLMILGFTYRIDFWYFIIPLISMSILTVIIISIATDIAVAIEDNRIMREIKKEIKGGGEENEVDERGDEEYEVDEGGNEKDAGNG